MTPLPSVPTGRFLPTIRQAIESASRDAQAKPFDPDTVGRLGMVLHAHEQLLAAQQAYRRAAQLTPPNPAWRYYEGVVLAARGEHVVAAAAFRDCLRGEPTNTAARRRLADSLLAANKTEDAAAQYRQILAAAPEDPAALFGLGRATGRPELYEQAVQRYPAFGAAIFALAQHYRRSGRAEEADRLMANYDRHKTSGPPLEDPRLDLVTALNRSPSQLLRQAIQMEREGRLPEAAQLNEQALASDPQLTQAHINLLSAYARLGDSVRAEQHYRAAIAQNPTAAEAHYNFGVLCLDRHQPQQAAAAFEAALRADPNHALSLANLGAILASRGDLAGAAKRLRQAIQVQPDLRIARFQLGRILANQRQYAEAMAHLAEAVRIEDEATPSYLYALGATQARAGQRTAAIATLEQARRLGARYQQNGLVAAVGADLARLSP